MEKAATSIYLLVCLSLAFLGFVLTNSMLFSLCLSDQYICRDSLNNLGDPLMYGMGALSVVFFVLLLVPKAFRVWQRFAIWYLPLALSLFLFYRDPGSGDLFSPYPETVYQWVGGAYIVLSVLVILLNGRKKGGESGPLIQNRVLQIVWFVYIAWLLFSVARWLWM